LLQRPSKRKFPHLFKSNTINSAFPSRYVIIYRNQIQVELFFWAMCARIWTLRKYALNTVWQSFFSCKPYLLQFESDRRVLRSRAEPSNQKRTNKISSIYLDLILTGRIFKDILSVRVESYSPILRSQVLWSNPRS
jgi:hypothetical protein